MSLELAMNDIRDTYPIDDSHKSQNTSSCTYFKDLEEAKDYVMKNPGSTIIKNRNGPGYILKGSREKHEKYVSEDYKKYKYYQDDTRKKSNIKLGRPARSGLSWRDQEIAKLIKLHSSGQSINQISNALERTPLAISGKLNNLELISNEEHQKYLDDHYNTHS